MEAAEQRYRRAGRAELLRLPAEPDEIAEAIFSPRT
jgi:hypothetical protein